MTITAKEANQRFDKFLKKYLSKAPQSFLYKMLRKKNITLNNKKAAGNEMLQESDVVKLFLSDETIDKFHESKSLPKSLPKKRPPLSVIYEDEDLIFINKPANMLTQMGNGTEASLAEYLVEDLLSRKAVREEDLRAFRPSPANRLDRNTSGIVLCSKTLAGAQFLSEMIRSRDLKKEYLVLVGGKVTKSAVETAYFTKDHAKNKVTLYDRQIAGSEKMITGITTLQSSSQASLLAIDLITGKTHQIRAHLAFLGHPVLGDRKYGDEGQNRRLMEVCGIRRQMLHARTVTFPSLSGHFSYLSQKSFTAEVPTDFAKAQAYLNFNTKNRGRS